MQETNDDEHQGADAVTEATPTADLLEELVGTNVPEQPAEAATDTFVTTEALEEIVGFDADAAARIAATEELSDPSVLAPERPDDPADAVDTTHTRRAWYRRAVFLVPVILLIIAAAAVGSWLTLVRHWEEQVSARMEESSERLADWARDLAAAAGGSPADLAREAGVVRGDLVAAQEDVERERTTRRRDVAMKTLTVELSLIEAVAGLDEEDLLTQWPQTRTRISALGDALDAQERAWALESGLSPRLRSSVVIAAVDVAVLAHARAEGRDIVRDVVRRRPQASSLSDVRDLGHDAQRRRTDLDALLSAIAVPAAEADKTEEALLSYADVLDRLGHLAELDAAAVARWADFREGIDAAATGMRRGVDRAEDGAVSSDVHDALRRFDQVVARADAALGEWREAVKTVEQEKAAQLAALGAYEAEFASVMQRYQVLRDDTEAFTRRIETDYVTWNEAYAYFFRALEDRKEIRKDLAAVHAPAALGPAHAEVDRVIGRAITAIEAGIAGMDFAFGCYYCYYKDSPGWQTFQSESRGITKAFDAAQSGWRQAAQAERDRIDSLPLPEEPLV